MSYLGVDTAQAQVLVSSLHDAAAGADDVQRTVMQGQRLCDFAVGVDLPLDEIAVTYRLLAGAVRSAVAELRYFQLPPVARLITPATPSVRSDTLAWNQVRQPASHNSFAVPGGVAGLFELGIRTFELDIHRGAPTDLTPSAGSLPIISRAVTIAADHLTHDGGAPDDWRVYHATGSSESEYEYLSTGLQAVVSLPTSDPITVFVDNKDNFGGTHTAEQLDEVIQTELGDRLYRPADLLGRAPAAGSLHEVISVAGWPTVQELQGKIIVVLTDEISSYDPLDPSLFVAPPPRFATVSGSVVHLPDLDAVFYNVNARQVSRPQLVALQQSNSVVRTYFNSTCGDSTLANYRAIDVSSDNAPCR